MFKILIQRSKEYKELFDESRENRKKAQEYEMELSALQATNSDLSEKVNELEQYERDYEELRGKYEQLRGKMERDLSREIEKRMEELGIGIDRFEQLLVDREDLIELYIEKLYSLAKHFTGKSKELKKNRGLFIVLSDEQNLVDDNFSVFHEGQEEHLEEDGYEGIDNLPNIFSPKIENVFDYMGEKIEVTDEEGKIIAHLERDGTLLINLKGLAFKSCMMVEGVRTHKVYDSVEPLKEGNAKHNAAIYASSLDEVMAVVVVSEETSKVTLFKDGRFIKSYDPNTKTEETRADIFGEEAEDKKVISIKQRLTEVVESGKIAEPAEKQPKEQATPEALASDDVSQQSAV